MKNKSITAVLLSAALSSGAAAAYPPSLAGPIIKWDRPVFGARRLPDGGLKEKSIPGQIRIFDRAEIENSGARTVQELLGKEPGVVSIDSIGNGVQQAVDLRGFNATPVPSAKLVVDGVAVNEADFGQVNFHLIPLSSVERVEVHYGPSTRFGRGALSGVVHITTRRGAEGPLRAETGASYGSFNKKQGHVFISGAASGVDYRVEAVKDLSDGYRYNARTMSSTMKAKLGFKSGESSDLWLSYQRSDDRLQQPGSLSEAEYNSDPRAHVSKVDFVSRLDFVSFENRIALPWDLTASWNAHLRERTEYTPENRGRTSVSTSLSAMKSRGAAAQLSRESEFLDRRVSFSGGAELRRDEADSRSSGYFGNTAFASGSITKERSYGAFAETTTELIPDALSATAGLRYDEARFGYEDRATATNSGRQAFHRSSPRFGLNFAPADFWRGWVSYGESFRTPSMSEISALGPVASNPLRPVRAQNAELGAKFRLAEDAELSIAGFRTEVRDEIYFDPTAGAFGKNVNIDRTRRLGIDWSLQAVRGRWEMRAGHAWTKATFETDFALSRSGGGRQNIQSGDVMPMVPEHKGSLGLAFKPAESWRLSADEICVGSMRVVGDEANVENTQTAYCETNLGARWDKGDWTVFANGFNVLNSQHPVRGIYSTLGGVRTRFVTPASGISASAGFSWRFSAGEGAVAKKGGSIVQTARNALKRN